MRAPSGRATGEARCSPSRAGVAQPEKAAEQHTERSDGPAAYAGSLPRRRGFTVIEMVIVVTLVAIVTAMAMPQDQLHRVAGRCRRSRHSRRAPEGGDVGRGSQHNMLVAVDVPNGRLFIVEDVNNNLQADPGERVTSVALQDGVIFACPRQHVVRRAGADGRHQRHDARDDQRQRPVAAGVRVPL